MFEASSCRGWMYRTMMCGCNDVDVAAVPAVLPAANGAVCLWQAGRSKTGGGVRYWHHGTVWRTKLPTGLHRYISRPSTFGWSFLHFSSRGALTIVDMVITSNAAVAFGQFWRKRLSVKLVTMNLPANCSSCAWRDVKECTKQMLWCKLRQHGQLT